MDLRRKLEERSTLHSVIGLGYIGLPLAVEFAKAGLRTVVVEIHGGKVDPVITGHSKIDYSVLVERCPLIFDSRNVLKGYSGDSIVTL
ncbi:MAG: hypothetical protein PHQ19_04635 [Candidatus Krumholzibacteria bacterium]|nr:hypothetical protein [Candidatus Krumholzibacteria bacterium]